MQVAVTGGSGRIGRYIVREFVEHGWDVTNVDAVPAPELGVRFQRIDVTDYGAVVEALATADAVVHMAAIPDPTRNPEHVVFRVNMLANWNVLAAAELHEIPKVVMASSINAIGASFSKAAVPPLYFPVDEQHPTRAEDGYAQSKWLGEEMAGAFCRRRQMQIASLRFHALLDADEQRQEQRLAISDPAEERGRSTSFWGWADRGDAARACRLALEAEWTGHEAFFINGDETVLAMETREAIERVYPGVALRAPLDGFASAIDNAKAERLLGWRHETRWVRDAAQVRADQ